MPDPCESADVMSAALANAASGPKRVKGDAGEVEQHGLKDLIEADKYLAGKCAAQSPSRGIRLTKLLPGGPA